MYIKKVVISNFKTYGQRIVVDDFNPGCNVIVGRNGSGKSNFFSAIEFVLNNELFNMDSSKRHQILNNRNPGFVLQEAFVEIIFDNSDNKFPNSENEVSLKRIIGIKRDNYFINKKNSTFTEVQSLLEFAGFSRTNPFYIVKQGKIDQLTTLSDAGRFELLLEIAGNKVFEDNVKSSKSIVTLVDNQLIDVDRKLGDIKEQLDCLIEGKDQFEKYIIMERKKNYLQYLMYSKEFDDVKNELENLNDQLQEKKDLKEKLTYELTEVINNLKLSYIQLKKLDDKEKETVENYEDLKNDKNELIKKQKTMELSIAELNEKLIDYNEQTINNISNQIQTMEAELNDKKLKYEEKENELEKLAVDLKLKEEKYLGLYKNNAHYLDANSQERKEWIKTQLEDLSKQLNIEKENKDKMIDSLNNKKHICNELNQELKKDKDAMDQLRQSIAKHENNKKELNIKLEVTEDKLKNQHKEEYSLKLDLSKINEDYSLAYQKLIRVVGGNTVKGFESVQKVVEVLTDKLDNDGKDNYHGLVIDNFTFDDNLSKAVEVTGGKYLFYHIVDIDNFGRKILEEMIKQNLPGEASFFSLNRIKTQPHNIQVGEDTIVLLNFIKYDKKHENIFNKIFGKTVCCRNFEVAKRHAIENNLNCVLSNGHQIFSNGSLRGGSIAKSRLLSSIKAYINYKSLKEKSDDLQRKLNIFNENKLELDKEIKSILSDIQNVKLKIKQEQFDCDCVEKRIISNEIRIQEMQDFINSSVKNCMKSNNEISEIERKIEDFQKESTKESLSIDYHENKQKESLLYNEIIELKKRHKQLFSELITLKNEKQKIENRLIPLYKDKDDFDKKYNKDKGVDIDEQLKNNEIQLDKINQKLNNIYEELMNKQRELDATNESKMKEMNKINQLEDDKKKLNIEIKEAYEEFESLETKYELKNSHLNNCRDNIDQLKPLSNPSEFESYRNLSKKNYMKEIEIINQFLSKFNLGNAKAFQQFQQLDVDYKVLLEKRQKITVEKQRLLDLIETLSDSKNQQINLTLKEIAKNFEDIFRILVPGGNAKLIIKTNPKKITSTSGGMDISAFTGVGIQVSFSSEQGELKDMKELSGGQKTIVSLTLIFAIQKCNPAPFYLFDEIDGALDSARRQVISDMIENLKGQTQFILTTFRPELLQCADKFYGVEFKHNLSHIDGIDKEKAEKFVKNT